MGRLAKNLSDDEIDMLFALANFAEEHPGKAAMQKHPEQRKVSRQLLRRGFLMLLEFESGKEGYKITQSGFDKANELWESHPNNPERKQEVPNA